MEKSGRLSLTGSKILVFGSQCSTNFQPVLDCFIPKFKLKYDDLENIKTDRVNTVVFNLHEIKQLKYFGGYPVFCNSPGAKTKKVACFRSLFDPLSRKQKPIFS